jgi:hypothetical protein
MTEKIITKSLIANSPLRGLWSEHAQNCDCDLSPLSEEEIKKNANLVAKIDAESASEFYFSKKTDNSRDYLKGN